MAKSKLLARFGFAFLGFLGLWCLWVRIGYPAMIPFIADEPLFQMILDDHFRAGTFPLVSMRGSSIPLAYGAGAMWIYGALRQLFSSLEALAFVHGLLYSLGLLSVPWLLRGRVSNSILAIVTLMALGSPFLFFFSRLLWDNTFFVFLMALLLCLLDQIDRRGADSLPVWIGMGALAGYMLNIHLMIAPVLLAAGITALVVLARSGVAPRRAWLLAGSALGVFVLMVAPYLWEAVRLYYSEGVAEKSGTRSFWGDGRNLWWLWQRSFIYLGFWKAKDLFGVVFVDFRAFCGPWLGTIFSSDILAWIPKALAMGYALSLPWRWWRGDRLLALQWMVGLSLAFMLFFLNLINIPTEAHYFHGLWWLGFLALAFALEGLPGRWRLPLTAVVAVCAILNSVFTIQSARFVQRNEGMRNLTYGTAMREIRFAMEELCRKEPAGSIPIFVDGVQILRHPVRYFNDHLPDCVGKKIMLVNAPEQAHWRLRYREPAPSARLGWERR